MKINSIKIKNLGSYQGQHSFDTATDKDKNIILFGGKNGAGKTTLFNSVRLCLYGHISMGYKVQNYYYYRDIMQMLNDDLKISKAGDAEVELSLSIVEGNEEHNYILSRKWTIQKDESIKESFNVKKGGQNLENAELADFEKYIVNLIHPELFNLYFFDGEKIKDFFLEEEGNKNIKKAFFTLCGYDTFELMKKNFTRVRRSGKKNESDLLLEKYISAKSAVEDNKKQIREVELEIEHCKNRILECDAALANNKKEYVLRGGITPEELKEKEALIKIEESNRTNLNTELKKLCNEKLPFLVISDLLIKLENRIKEESKLQKISAFNELISEAELQKQLKDKIGDMSSVAFATIREYVNRRIPEGSKMILDLSEVQSAEIFTRIKEIQQFDKNRFAEIKKEIQISKSKTDLLHRKMKESNAELADNYIAELEKISGEKAKLFDRQLELEKNLGQLILDRDEKAKVMEKAHKEVKESLKRESISDISAKALIMLDKLEKVLFEKQVIKVEKNFMQTINELTYKKHFIDDIYIDENFDIHIYKYQDVMSSDLYKMLVESGREKADESLGIKAFMKLKELFKVEKDEEVLKRLAGNEKEKFSLPIEINKNVLSSGEKQIFIMSLYFSMVQLNNKEIPFIIDTPFARIDMDNRENLTRKFFRNLQGQVFILSTDQEFEQKHVSILEDKLAKTYLLKNNKNNGTVVYEDRYFEV